MLTSDKDMKLIRDRRASQDSQPVTTRRRVSQDNKRKFSDEGTVAEQQPKKQLTSSTDSHEEMSSPSSDDESDNYTDSDGGDIPYEDGLPRRVVSQVFLCLTGPRANSGFHCSFAIRFQGAPFAARGQRS